MDGWISVSLRLDAWICVSLRKFLLVSQMYEWIDTWMDSVSLRYSFYGKSDVWMDGCNGWMR